jgi:hypothetical protein
MLPVELYRLIIDILYDDTDTLKACSLTCKTFLHLSRYHLFYDIYLYRGNDTKSFLDTIGSIHPTSPGTYVRHLSLEVQDGWPNIPLLTTRLPNVTSLDLNFNFNEDETGRLMMLSGFQKITFLNLDFCWFKTSAEMNEFIVSFPLLEHLCCPRLEWLKYAEPTIPLPHSINKITLAAYHSTFFDQLLSLERRPIRAIELSKITGNFMNELNKLLKTLGSQLEDLQICKINS